MKTKLSKKAIALLRKVQKTIKQEPERLAMGAWAIQRDDEDVADVPNDINPLAVEHRQLPPCGTVGCIAGWTVICSLKPENVPTVTINGHEMIDVSELSDIDNEAKKLLGVTEQEAQKLFYMPTWEIAEKGIVKAWPKRFADKYAKAKTAEERAQIACDRIDYFIEHVA